MTCSCADAVGTDAPPSATSASANAVARTSAEKIPFVLIKLFPRLRSLAGGRPPSLRRGRPRPPQRQRVLGAREGSRAARSQETARWTDIFYSGRLPLRSQDRIRADRDA